MFIAHTFLQFSFRSARSDLSAQTFQRHMAPLTERLTFLVWLGYKHLAPNGAKADSSTSCSYGAKRRSSEEFLTQT